ncbi:translational GTPase TypA [Buchnera aphidicola]|uniref:50S ribosomal subunit assembly factor BipA n=1 Tax=Buchnera aphidicola (Stegophylla sp.) TaxID=2315800 RepID=A0A4D6YN19_9GAMM|nr:translational GTPase TypA [Buchnera aphidicola (Stegophylla sp.)]QCI26425.1 translational GTPase TypA [Buchnera aphidicola (Stegophylla sp.)]
MVVRLKNIAIIAHIDHGKTTLLDQILKQSGTLKNKKENIHRIMDSNELEKERGITISSKNTSIQWNKYHINIIDTPGHSDFGGEVERVMSMVDSVLLVVDASDGPMPQTRFVTKKAFAYNLNPIVVINKIDRKDARPDWVIDQIFDLFINLNAKDEQLDFPIVYTSALLGTSGIDYNKMENNMNALYNAIIKHTPSPKINLKNNLQIQISQLDYDKYLGVIGIGRIHQGIICNNQIVSIINQKGTIKQGKIGKILKYFGLQKIEVNNAHSGEIIAITGLNNLHISDTICDINNNIPLPPVKIDPPTVNMLFSVNTSPFCGQEGKYITSTKIYDRLRKEIKHNISMKIQKTSDSNIFSVSGRGELHLSILIETMRREGFELEVSRPKIIFKYQNDITTEPFENVVIDIENQHQGIIIEYMGQKKGKMKNIIPDYQGRTKLEYIVSSRALIGFQNEFMNITSGTGLFYSSFSHYGKKQNHNIGNRKNGVLISNGTGITTGFALFNLQNRGKLFLGHAEKVYQGQIIGIHNRSNDLTVNCLTGKKLTNMRASGTDEAISLIPPINMTLEKALGFINDDELVEITPSAIRIRKKYLTENDRKIQIRKNKQHKKIQNS